MSRLLGRYENFPETIHGVGRFRCRSSKSKVQRVILRTLQNLNEQLFRLRDMTRFSSSECEVSFELGIANGIEFNYLDEDEVNRLRERATRKALPALDFFCVVRYHTTKDGKRVPLKFDYFILRFVFHNNSLELWVSHQRGIRRVSVEELITFIAKRIDEELSQNRLETLELKTLQAL